MTNYRSTAITLKNKNKTVYSILFKVNELKSMFLVGIYTIRPINIKFPDFFNCIVSIKKNKIDDIEFNKIIKFKIKDKVFDICNITNINLD